MLIRGDARYAHSDIFCLVQPQYVATGARAGCLARCGLVCASLVVFVLVLRLSVLCCAVMCASACAGQRSWAALPAAVLRGRQRLEQVRVYMRVAARGLFDRH